MTVLLSPDLINGFLFMDNKNWYAVITADVLYCKTLTPRQKLLAAAIANMSNNKGYCFASNKHFAEMMDCSPRSIQRDLSVLEQQGHIGRVVILKENGEVDYRALTPFGGVVSQMTRGTVTDDIRGHVTDDTYNNKENNNRENKPAQQIETLSSADADQQPTFMYDIAQLNAQKQQPSIENRQQLAVYIISKVYLHYHQEPTATEGNQYLMPFMNWVRQLKTDKIWIDFCDGLGNLQDEWLKKLAQSDKMDLLIKRAQEVIAHSTGQLWDKIGNKWR